MNEEIAVNNESALYKAGEKIGKFVAKTQDALEDKHISTTEWVGIGGALGSAALSIVQNREELGADLADGMNDQEMANIKAGFVSGYDIEDDTLESTVEKWAGYGADAVNALAKLILARKDDGKGTATETTEE